MATTGKFKLTTRTAFTSIREVDLTKYPGQASVVDISGLDNLLTERIVSRPATGHRQVYNITYDPHNEELIIEISETDAD